MKWNEANEKQVNSEITLWNGDATTTAIRAKPKNQDIII